MGDIPQKRRDKPTKTYPLFGRSLERVITQGVGAANHVVPWIVRHGGDRRRAYAWLRGQISGTRTLTNETLAILLCHSFQQGFIHGLGEVWGLLNRGPERFWDLMHRLFQLQPWGISPCPERSPQDCCFQAPIETIGWYLSQTIPTFPADVLPPYRIERSEVASLLHKRIRQGWDAKKPVLISAPRTSGMTTLFRRAVACTRIAVRERQTGERAPLARCLEWRNNKWPFAQAIYWRDRPDWDHAVWMQRLLDPNEPDGIGLGDISSEMLNALPVLLFLDDLRSGRPLQALQERLGPNAVVVAGRHGTFAAEDGILIALPALRENEARALMRRYWKIEGAGGVHPLPQGVQHQIVALSGGNLGFVLELLNIARQITPERMAGYLRGARYAPSQRGEEVPMAERRAIAFVGGLLRTLTPTQRKALRKVVALPYLTGYSAWELAQLWRVDESSAHVLLGELVKQGFGVFRPGGLAGHWHLSPVMYRWLRRAFEVTDGEEKFLLSVWKNQVLSTPWFKQYRRALVEDLERPGASGEHVYTAYIDEIRMPLRRMNMLKRIAFYLRHREAYALEVWRSMPAGTLTTGEYFLGKFLLPEAERAAHRLHFWTLLGAAIVFFLYFTLGLGLENPALDTMTIISFLWLLFLWMPWLLWLFYQPRIVHRWFARLLRRALKHWQQDEFAMMCYARNSHIAEADT